LTGDDRVDERQHCFEHLIVRGQTIHARGAPRAGQVRIEAQPAIPLREEGFHESYHDAVIARLPRQHHDGPTGAVGFIEDHDISEVTFHMLMPPFMRTHRRHPLEPGAHALPACVGTAALSLSGIDARTAGVSFSLCGLSRVTALIL